MTKLKFGLSQIEKETPKVVSYIYKTIQFASVAFGVIILYLPIPTVIQLHITTALLVGNKLLSSFCSMFGVPDPGLVSKEEVDQKVDKIKEKIDPIVAEIKEAEEIPQIKKLVTEIEDKLTGITGL